MLTTLIAAALMNVAITMDVEAGTTLCASEDAALEYLDATATDDQSRLLWLMGTACFRAPVDVRDLQVLDIDDQLITVLWPVNRVKKTRFVIKPEEDRA